MISMVSVILILPSFLMVFDKLICYSTMGLVPAKKDLGKERHNYEKEY